jgi:hypothetical protein
VVQCARVRRSVEPSASLDLLPYAWAVDAWQEDWIVGPVDDILSHFPDGSEVPLGQCQGLGQGIDGVFRTQVGTQFRGWPPGSTTDGASVDICIKRGPSLLEVVGLMYIDLEGETFPYRALISRTESKVSLQGFIGQVDETTGPPRLARGSLINPVRNEEDSVPTPELFVGRHRSPIVWTEALTWSWPTPG